MLTATILSSSEPFIKRRLPTRSRRSPFSSPASLRRLGYLATFLLEEKGVPKPVDVRGALDASLITEVLEG
jgi:hypothetical protein